MKKKKLQELNKVDTLIWKMNSTLPESVFQCRSNKTVEIERYIFFSSFSGCVITLKCSAISYYLVKEFLLQFVHFADKIFSFLFNESYYDILEIYQLQQNFNWRSSHNILNINSLGKTWFIEFYERWTNFLNTIPSLVYDLEYSYKFIKVKVVTLDLMITNLFVLNS